MTGGVDAEINGAPICKRIAINRYKSNYRTSDVKLLKVKEDSGILYSSCKRLVISWSVWDRCVSMFSLCGLCLFIVDSTVER